MAGAKRELEDAVSDLREDEAELVLSLVHYIRSRGAEGEDASPPGDTFSLAGWILLLDRLEDQAASDVLALLRRRADEGESTRAWLGLAEPALAREWDRPEEDEAWADL